MPEVRAVFATSGVSYRTLANWRWHYL